MAEFDEIKEGHNKIPLGWVLFFVGVIVWLVYYIVAYTPEISGWSHNRNFDEQMRAAAPPAAGMEMPAANPYAMNKQAAEEGEEIYEKFCEACHGDDLKEPAVGVDLRGDLSYGGSDAELFESIYKGRPNGMPPFGQQLGNDRTWKVVTYIAHERGED